MVLPPERPWPPDQRSSTAAGKSEKIVISSCEGERVVELDQKQLSALRPFFSYGKGTLAILQVAEDINRRRSAGQAISEGLLHSTRLILDREKAGPPVVSSFPAADGENISVAEARSRV